MFWDPRPFTSNWGWSNATFLFNKYRFHFVLNIFGAPGASVCRTLGATRRRDGQCCGEKGALRSRSCSPDVTLEIFAMYRVCVCVYYCREMYTDVYKLMQTDVYWYILCRLDSIAAGYSADVALLYPDILMILMACRVSIWRTVSILNILELLKELFFKTYIIYNTYIYIYMYIYVFSRYCPIVKLSCVPNKEQCLAYALIDVAQQLDRRVSLGKSCILPIIIRDFCKWVPLLECVCV